LIFINEFREKDFFKAQQSKKTKNVYRQTGRNWIFD